MFRCRSVYMEHYLHYFLIIVLFFSRIWRSLCSICIFPIISFQFLLIYCLAMSCSCVCSAFSLFLCCWLRFCVLILLSSWLYCVLMCLISSVCLGCGKVANLGCRYASIHGFSNRISKSLICFFINVCSWCVIDIYYWDMLCSSLKSSQFALKKLNLGRVGICIGKADIAVIIGRWSLVVMGPDLMCVLWSFIITKYYVRCSTVV